MDELRDAIRHAYIAGALDVHGNWQEDRDPDFAEAASDYADSQAAILEALTRQASADGLREHRDFWLKSWFELEGAASALVAKVEALADGECGPFAIKNSIANSPEMNVLRSALASGMEAPSGVEPVPVSIRKDDSPTAESGDAQSQSAHKRLGDG
jgi:hypothetical protein